MSHVKFVAGILALAAIVSPATLGQSPQEQQKKIDDLGRRLDQVLKEQEALKAALASRDTELQSAQASQKDEALESYISSLSERLAGPGTTVKSVASPITFTGEFRVRTGWTLDRNFGEPNGILSAGAGLLGIILKGFELPELDGGYYKSTKAEYFFATLASLAAAIVDDDAIDDEDHDDDGQFTEARFRIGLQFDLAKDVTTYFELQAYGVYDNGVTPYPSTTTPFNDVTDGLSEVDLYQGYIRMSNLFNRPEFSSTAGRQEITLGNEFQFGNNDFFNGESFDGVRYDWNSESFSLTGMALTLQSHTFHDGFKVRYPDPITGYDDDMMYSLYLTLKVIEHHEIDLYWIYLNGHSPAFGSFGTEGGIRSNYLLEGLFNTAYYHTVGGRIGGTFPSVAAGLDWNVEAAFQFGDTKDVLGIPGTSQDVDGWTIEAEVGLMFQGAAHFRVFGRFLFADGGDMFGQDTGYIPLFPERHSQTGYRARYGIFDIIPMSNVITGQLGITFDPDPAWTIGLTGLWAAHDQNVITGFDDLGFITTDDGIGWEADAFIEYRYSPQTTLSLGLAVFFPNDGAPLAGFFPLERIVGTNEDDVAFMAYLQAEVVF